MDKIVKAATVAGNCHILRNGESSIVGVGKEGTKRKRERERGKKEGNGQGG